jgi:hypothetical protein
VSVATQYPYEQPRIEVRAYRAPNPEPPYDDVPPIVRLRPVAALAPWLGPPGLRLVPEPEEADEEVSFEAQRTPREGLEDPRPRAAMLARALLEVLTGTRPVAQLLRWTAPEVFARLEPLAATHRGGRGVCAVRRVLVSEPAPGIAEVSAVVQRGPRCGALALRMEGLDGRWVVTALQLG